MTLEDDLLLLLAEKRNPHSSNSSLSVSEHSLLQHQEAMELWWVSKDSQQIGPLTVRQLAALGTLLRGLCSCG